MRGFDPFGQGHGSLDVSQSSRHRRFGTVRLSNEFQRNTAGLTHANKRIVTASGSEPFQQCIEMAVVLLCKLEMECEGVFHRVVLCRLRCGRMVFMALAPRRRCE